MDFFRKLFSGFQQKDFNPAIFSIYAPRDSPKIGEKEFLKAHTGWVSACVNAISKRVADIEIKLQQRTKGDWKDIDLHPYLDLLRKPNPFHSFYDVVYATQAYRELEGNSFWYISQNGKQTPAEVWPLDPTRMSVVKSQQNFISGYMFQNQLGTLVPIDTNEVIHFKNFHPENPTGEKEWLRLRQSQLTFLSMGQSGRETYSGMPPCHQESSTVKEC